MLSILGFIIIIVAAIHVYRTAKQYDRNAIGWTLITIGVGFGIQLILPLFLGIIIGIVMIASGSSIEEMQGSLNVPAFIIGLICLALSIAAVLLILRYVSKIPDEPPFTPPPSPPETFN
ncbi:MAG TPA: hypothetical protein VK892_00705 [Pyrinomonadaceae bacterium]|nr:hypothetical protein [Pyrinomonadaceae bacterium]